MKKLAILCVLICGACSEPPSKENSSSNAQPNNVNSVNVNPNNVNSANVNPNNVNSSNPTFLDPNDFDQVCELDSDCSLVWGGDICGCGAICPEAIATSAVEDFAAARDAIMCDPNADPVACPGAECEVRIAVCSSGDCEAITQRIVQAEQFDQSCEVDADCVLVTTGAICAACDCGRGAINVNALEDYEAAWGDPDCNPGPSPCDCAPATDAFCNEGTCEAGFGG